MAPVAVNSPVAVSPSAASARSEVWPLVQAVPAPAGSVAMASVLNSCSTPVGRCPLDCGTWWPALSTQVCSPPATRAPSTLSPPAPFLISPPHLSGPLGASSEPSRSIASQMPSGWGPCWPSPQPSCPRRLRPSLSTPLGLPEPGSPLSSSCRTQRHWCRAPP